MIIIEFWRKPALCSSSEMFLSLLTIYAYTYMLALYCLNTGISRAESDLRPFHIFIWEISVPLR